MNYIELINRYWQEVDVKGFTPAEATIYFRLLDICNRLGWENPFSLSNPRAVALMAVTENTLAAGRDKLVMKGLIGFKRGSRRKDIPMYCFPEKVEGLWMFPEGFTSSFTSNIEAKRGAKPEAKRGAKPEAINKTKNKTNNSPNGECARARERSLFTESELKKTTTKGVKTTTEFLPPTKTEVRDYFLSQRADVRLQDWETEAEIFFSYYDSQGWVRSSGRKVINWDSLANDWIIRKEKEQRKNKTDEQRNFSRTQRTTPDDTLADEQEKLARRIIARRVREDTTGSSDSEGTLPF